MSSDKVILICRREVCKGMYAGFSSFGKQVIPVKIDDVVVLEIGSNERKSVEITSGKHWIDATAKYKTSKGQYGTVTEHEEEAKKIAKDFESGGIYELTITLTRGPFTHKIDLSLQKVN